MKYGAILADPPWPYYTGKAMPYNMLSLEEIALLSIGALAAKDCVLFCWTTFPYLDAGISTVRAWGFRFVTIAFTWIKTNSKADSYFVGMGFWTRGSAEVCLLGIKGHPRRKRKDVRQLIVAHRREHSRKPDEQYGRIESLVDGPYLELFARYSHPGWDCWGNEIESTIELEVS